MSSNGGFCTFRFPINWVHIKIATLWQEKCQFDKISANLLAISCHRTYTVTYLTTYMYTYTFQLTIRIIFHFVDMSFVLRNTWVMSRRNFKYKWKMSQCIIQKLIFQVAVFWYNTCPIVVTKFVNYSLED